MENCGEHSGAVKISYLYFQNGEMRFFVVFSQCRITWILIQEHDMENYEKSFDWTFNVQKLLIAIEMDVGCFSEGIFLINITTRIELKWINSIEKNWMMEVGPVSVFLIKI